MGEHTLRFNLVAKQNRKYGQVIVITHLTVGYMMRWSIMNILRRIGRVTMVCIQSFIFIFRFYLPRNKV